MRRVLVLVTALLTTALVTSGPASARAADVHGDDARDVYVGTGGLLLPGTVDDGARRRVAGCGGCRWRLTTVCTRPDPELGQAFDERRGCDAVVHGCPQRQRVLRAWFRPAGGIWQEVAVVCVGEPVTVAHVGEEVADRVEEGMPALRPAFRPTQGVVTQLPVAFSTGQPAGPRRWSMQVVGRVVDVTAVPSWWWSFGDGAASSGAAVAHAYRRPGTMRVEVRTRWTATFVVDGLGPFDVPETVTQATTFDLRIGEGRAVLVPGRAETDR